MEHTPGVMWRPLAVGKVCAQTVLIGVTHDICIEDETSLDQGCALLTRIPLPLPTRQFHVWEGVALKAIEVMTTKRTAGMAGLACTPPCPCPYLCSPPMGSRAWNYMCGPMGAIWASKCIKPPVPLGLLNATPPWQGI